MPRNHILPCFKNGTDVQSSIDQLQKQRGGWIDQAHVMLKVQLVHGTRPQLVVSAVFKQIRVTIWTARYGRHAQAQKTDTTYLKGVHLSAGLILRILLLLQQCSQTCQPSIGRHHADLSMLGCFSCVIMAFATQSIDLMSARSLKMQCMAAASRRTLSSYWNLLRAIACVQGGSS